MEQTSGETTTYGELYAVNVMPDLTTPGTRTLPAPVAAGREAKIRLEVAGLAVETGGPWLDRCPSNLPAGGLTLSKFTTETRLP
jgi:hypothetical protein